MKACKIREDWATEREKRTVSAKTQGDGGERRERSFTIMPQMCENMVTILSRACKEHASKEAYLKASRLDLCDGLTEGLSHVGELVADLLTRHALKVRPLG